MSTHRLVVPKLQHQCTSAHLPHTILSHANPLQGTATLAPTPGDVGNTASPTQSPIFVSLTDQGGCPAEFNDSSNYEEGDKVSVNGIVFQCQAWPNSLFCNQSGFEPDLDSALENWKQAWLVLGYCSGTLAPSTSIPTYSTVTIAPTLSPSFPATTDSPTSANVGGCPIVWAAGGSMTYKENDEVSVIESSGTGRKAVYKCKAWPASAYCGQFSPIDLNGGKLGWEYVGGCVGTITPTSSPTYDASSVIAGCPVAYTATSSTYQAGDKVSRTVSTTPLRKQVYQCRDWPGSVYCNQKTFAPGTEFDYMAWTVLGPCEGTLAPTAAPTSYGGLCTYEKVVDASPTPTPVAEWSLGTSYEAGDQVRIGLAKFECKPWPYYFWCRVASYAPTLSDTGSWTEAWTPAGACDP